MGKPRIDAAMVEEFVSKAHGDLARVTALLEQEPNLVNACWDWGGGDWETALGAAAHMGRRDIAELLLSKGARIDLFAAAMLGKLEIVRAILTDNPAAAQSPGPHGIGLMTHTKKGGPAAAEVVAYLQSLGKKLATAKASGDGATPKAAPKRAKAAAASR